MVRVASVFTVWRPTSNDAIKNMMTGRATGKGLDIKGKSARSGNISSYVPFVQIFEEGCKAKCEGLAQGGRALRVFYRSKGMRDEARQRILVVIEKLDGSERVELINDYSGSVSPLFGLETSKLVFWEAYVTNRDISRPAGTEWDISRQSSSYSMGMNMDSIRRDREADEPRAVIYQMPKSGAMETRMLLMAYEENGGEMPVVSDFDCFVVGSRGVRYTAPPSPEQIESMKWSVDKIEEVLDEQSKSDSRVGWTEAWTKKLMGDWHPVMPRYGTGGPRLYKIFEVVVSRLEATGCKRHGAECFNWYFPQEMDNEFLVISEGIEGNVNWKKVGVDELQNILISKIDEGFTFPVNPKWVLCDPGWRRVYDRRLLASNCASVQDSLNCWLSPESGLREKIDCISRRHPRGFDAPHGRTKESTITMLMNEMHKFLERERAEPDNHSKRRRLSTAWERVRVRVRRGISKGDIRDMDELEAISSQRSQTTSDTSSIGRMNTKSMVGFRDSALVSFGDDEENEQGSE